MKAHEIANKEELINALRYHADATIHDCDGCPYQPIHKTKGICLDKMISDAADALEAADEKIADYIVAIEALDDSNDAYIKENERLKKRIAELEAQLPKEVVHGEWVGIHEYINHLEKVTGEKFQVSNLYDGYNFCNNCWDSFPRKFNYCPNCGAKMDGEEKKDETDC